MLGVRKRRRRRLNYEAGERYNFKCIDCEWNEGQLTGDQDPEGAARYHAKRHGHYVTFYYEGQAGFDYRDATASTSKQERDHA